ncbi:uncharacterized protein LOC6585084 [Drosophila mojavensis]|uniref:Uncharacterized protein n=1 Tax=Drosophila mojavensis TaxID=7230 RepID=B4L5C0_DROMO|nr:uncharacterized protein LOC6585084 [Drosophila mojavensis]EDW06379.1 uncharacterized protein Dmoj_GI21699 [Drosophila mojavensis]
MDIFYSPSPFLPMAIIVESIQRMRNIRAFREAIRDLVNRYVSIEVFSIWHNRHAYNRRKYVILSTIKNWMPWLFWFFAVYSALGLTHQFFQFLRAKLIVDRPVGMWRERCFYGLRDETIRQMRILGSIIMLLCWLLLFIGVVWSLPKCIKPWLTIMGVILPFDFILWSMEVIVGFERFTWQGLVSFMLPFICKIVLGFMKAALEEPTRKLFQI